ncbi:hypothetical protein [Paenibacillus turpanensis]|uniref:hypothetical protein n=1 Tax=Paenibacillus turpanensis TaxID=2689078 RepID=UPI001409F475|nr:hypothetical protein [Paenibacillus turpanensis]
MIPAILVQIALIVMVVRSAYVTFSLAQRSKKPWLDIAFHLSILILALSFLF